MLSEDNYVALKELKEKVYDVQDIINDIENLAIDLNERLMEQKVHEHLKYYQDLEKELEETCKVYGEIFGD